MCLDIQLEKMEVLFLFHSFCCGKKPAKQILITKTVYHLIFLLPADSFILYFYVIWGFTNLFGCENRLIICLYFMPGWSCRGAHLYVVWTESMMTIIVQADELW